MMFQCLAFGSLPREKLEIKLVVCKLLFTNLIKPFIATLHLEVSLSAFVHWDSHFENRISLCGSCILRKLAVIPFLESCQEI